MKKADFLHEMKKFAQILRYIKERESGAVVRRQIDVIKTNAIIEANRLLDIAFINLPEELKYDSQDKS